MREETIRRGLPGLALDGPARLPRVVGRVHLLQQATGRGHEPGAQCRVACHQPAQRSAQRGRVHGSVHPEHERYVVGTVLDFAFVQQPQPLLLTGGRCRRLR